MSDESESPTYPLEPIAYLARSEHRIQVFETLTGTSTKPGRDNPGYDARDLREETGASEATISRMLNEFQDRGWIERTPNGEYASTPLGHSIAVAFNPLVESMAAIQHLGEAVALLPFSELTIGLEHFKDARVRRPQEPVHLDVGQYYLDLLADSAQVYSLTYSPDTPTYGEELTEVLLRDDFQISMIFPQGYREPMIESNWGPGLEEYLAAGNEQYVYDGDISCSLLVADDTVVIGNARVDGMLGWTVIESTNPTVREWARDVFEQYRQDAEEIALDDLEDLGD